MPVFDENVITPNDAFFVRYHLAVAPPQSIYLDPDTYKFEVKGKVNKPLTISLNELKTQFDPVDSPSTNVPAMAAAFSSHASVVDRLPTASWATPAGKACL